VLRPAERFAVDDAHRLKQPVAIKKAAVEHGNHCAIFGHEFAIEKYEHADELGESQRSGEKKNVPNRLRSQKSSTESRFVSGGRMTHQLPMRFPIVVLTLALSADLATLEQLAIKDADLK
jgi:hypothetical protein